MPSVHYLRSYPAALDRAAAWVSRTRAELGRRGLAVAGPRFHATLISAASVDLVRRRDAWLNPPEWVVWLDEPVPGYPKRPAPRSEAAALALRGRTLTALYNDPPAWLVDAHARVDAAVAGAYGLPANIGDDDIVRELMRLNAERSA